MGEIYRDTVNSGLSFDIPAAVVTGVEFYRNGELVYTATPSSTVLLPYTITKRAGTFSVKWTYTLEGETHDRQEAHSIVTPVFTPESLKAWDDDFSSLSDAKIRDLERMVRQVIQTYCNQKFELEEGVIRLVPQEGGSYKSPERLLSLRAQSYSLSSDGYSVHNLNTYTSQGYNVKIPIEAEAYSLGWHAPVRGVVAVRGTYGWNSVPEEVKTAALYLAEAFSCDESLWRERYITSVRAADWRFDYSEGTIYSTGSLLADQLLTPFIRMEYSVV
jgi:hypothetical protein